MAVMTAPWSHDELLVIHLAGPVLQHAGRDCVPRADGIDHRQLRRQPQTNLHASTALALEREINQEGRKEREGEGGGTEVTHIEEEGGVSSVGDREEDRVHVWRGRERQ